MRPAALTMTAALLMATAPMLVACAPNSDAVNKKLPTSDFSAGLIIDLHNQARERGIACGGQRGRRAAHLHWNEKLASAALRHSRDMASKGFLKHRGSDRSSTKKRVNDTAYQWSKYGENLAYGHRGTQIAVNKWLQTRRHCTNMLDPKFTELGAAEVNGYLTVVYGAK